MGELRAESWARLKLRRKLIIHHCSTADQKAPAEQLGLKVKLRFMLEGPILGGGRTTERFNFGGLEFRVLPRYTMM